MTTPTRGIETSAGIAVAVPAKTATGGSSVDVQLDGISKRFGDITAVDDFSLRVASGEFLVLMGPSGSGKTTLLRIIAGVEPPDSGHVYLDGVLADDVPAGRRQVQMVFQTYALWPHMEVFNEREYSNISFPLKVRRWTSEMILERVRDITERVGLESSLFHRKPPQLSAGQQQRVAVARAMTTSPRVFLIDEPIANLDPPARTRVREQIKQLHQETGSTTIYVTHITADASRLADRIAIVRDGRLVQVGSPEHLWRHPADAFVHEFLTS